MVVVLRPVLPPPIQPFSITATLLHAVVLGEVIGGRQPMAAAADDDHVIARLRLWRAPGRLPAGVTAQAFPEQAECRIAPRQPRILPSRSGTPMPARALMSSHAHSGYRIWRTALLRWRPRMTELRRLQQAVLASRPISRYKRPDHSAGHASAAACNKKIWRKVHLARITLETASRPRRRTWLRRARLQHQQHGAGPGHHGGGRGHQRRRSSSRPAAAPAPTPTTSCWPS